MNPFSLILGVGASISLLRILQSSADNDRLRWLMIGLFTLVCSLIGARIGFVVSTLEYFKTNVREVSQFWLGGLSWPCSLAGAILGAWLASRILHKPFGYVADKLSVMLLPMAAAIWLACWQTGIAYGQVLESGTWWGALISDEAGVEALRVPVQPAAVLSLLFLLALCERLVGKSRQAGIKAGMIGLVFSIHALLFSFMRFDPVQRWLTLRLDTWAAICFIIGSFFFLFFTRRRVKDNNLLQKHLQDGVDQ